MTGKRITAIAVAALIGLLSGAAQQPEKPQDVWLPFKFFVGEWEGAGEGQPGISQGRQEWGEERKRSLRTSPGYDLHFSLEMTSPFVPDGRHSLAELSCKVLFPSVTFEFDPDEDPLLGRCQVNTGKGKGAFSKLVLNDVQMGEERLPAAFLSARPREFSAGLAVESEPMAEDEEAASSRTAPGKIRLSFWTEFGPAPITWGSRSGSASLPDFRIIFEVPFRDLIQGMPFSMTLPYEGRFPEDKGSWRIDIRPRLHKK